MVQLELDQGVGGLGIEVGVFAEKAVDDEGERDDKVRVLEGR
jgi:hypothetical protein